MAPDLFQKPECPCLVAVRHPKMWEGREIVADCPLLPLSSKNRNHSFIKHFCAPAAWPALSGLNLSIVIGAGTVHLHFTDVEPRS